MNEEQEKNTEKLVANSVVMSTEGWSGPEIGSMSPFGDKSFIVSYIAIYVGFFLQYLAALRFVFV